MEEMCFWLYSTAPQVIAALFTLTIAALAFRLSKLDEAMREDETLSDIINEVKRILHRSFKTTTVTTVIAIISDLLFIGINNYISNDSVLIIFILINLLALGFIIIFVVVIHDPDYMKTAIDNLMKSYNEGTVAASDYVMKFVELEQKMRECSSSQDFYIKYQHSLSQISRYLQVKGVFDKNDIDDFIQIKRLRNLILHEGEPSKVDKKLYDKLIRLILVLDSKNRR